MMRDAKNKMRGNLKQNRSWGKGSPQFHMQGFMNQFDTNLQNLSANTGYGTVNY
jgi:hypothetical protein